jgi:hypothetical protein
MKMNFKKTIAVAFIIIIIGSLILLALRILKTIYFFLIAAVCGFVAIKVVPKMR